MSYDMEDVAEPESSDSHAAAFIKAPYVQIRRRDESAYIVMNALTKQQYEFNSVACQILQRLSVPRSLNDLCAGFPGERPESIDDLLSYLRAQSLVVPAGQTGLNRRFELSRLNVNLFGAGDLDEKNDPPGVVAVGIPFGRGNAAPNHAHRAPQILRMFASTLNIRTDSMLAAEQLSGIYGRRIVWDDLLRTCRERRMKDWGDLFIFNHERNEVVYDKIRRMAGALFDAGHAPLFIGGDHSISFPLIEACAERHRGLHVIHFDAHTDTYRHRLDEYFADIATHHHGSFAARSMALEGVTVFHQFGIRGINNLTAEAPLDKQRIYWIGETREIAAGVSTLDLPYDAPYYVTLDVDVLDPSEAPGTTTPVPGGLRYPELIALIDRLLRGRRVVGVDLVEVDPERDVNNVTTHIGVELLLLLLNYLRPAPEASEVAGGATA